MKKQFFLATIIIACVLLGCKKSNNNNPNINNGQGTMSLTYAGKTITVDSVYSRLPSVSNDLKRIVGKNTNAVLNNTLSTGTFCYFDLDSLSIGKHIHYTYRQFDVGVLFLDNNTFISREGYEYIYTITSNTNNKLSGTFAFRINNSNPLDSARGIFKDISI